MTPNRPASSRALRPGSGGFRHRGHPSTRPRDRGDRRCSEPCTALVPDPSPAPLHRRHPIRPPQVAAAKRAPSPPAKKVLCEIDYPHPAQTVGYGRGQGNRGNAGNNMGKSPERTWPSSGDRTARAASEVWPARAVPPSSAGAPTLPVRDFSPSDSGFYLIGKTVRCKESTR